MHIDTRLLSTASASATASATGVRNTVGFDWDPISRKLFFTDNGRDNMGGAALKDNIPDCELNRVDVLQQHFGFPFCQSGGSGNPVARTPGVSNHIIDPDLNAGGSAFNCSRKSMGA
jgi:glucose/arabinose dehydrogenase